MLTSRVTFVLAGLLCLLLLAGSAPAADQIRDYEISMAKGQLALEAGEYKDAAGLFTQALSARPDDRQALLSLGIASSRSGDLETAKSALLKALAASPGDARTRYEIGVVMYRLGEQEEARDFFQALLAGAAPEDLRTRARQYLDRIAGKAPAEQKGLSLGVMPGVQYDSNVMLAPDDPASGASVEGKDDLRGVLMLDGSYRLASSGRITADIGYSFYANGHQDLTEFNVRQHTGRLAGTYAWSRTAVLGLEYRFIQSDVMRDHYAVTHSVAVPVTVSHAGGGRTELRLRYEHRNFRNGLLFANNHDRTGDNIAARLLHTRRIGGGDLSFGYEYDADSAKVEHWSAAAHKGILRYGTGLGAYRLTAAASYTDRKYDAVITGFYTEPRHDGIQEFSLSAARDLTKTFGINLTGTHILNDSNLPAYEYTRNIIGLFGVVRL